MNIVILLVSTAVVAVLAFLMICLLIDLVPKAEEKAPEKVTKAGAPSTRTFPTIARAVGTWTRLPKRDNGPASQTPRQ